MAMGTRFECVLGPASDLGLAERDLRAIGEMALEEIEECHRRFSRFSPDSLVSHLARTPAGEPVRLDEATWALFRDALRVGRDSGGAFDITVGTAMAARGFAQSAVAAPRSSVNQDDVVLDPSARTIRFTRAGAALDLGGIAKGHALDRAAACLRSHGIASAFLHGGTSSGIAIGRPDGANAWTVAVGTTDGTTLRLVDLAYSVSEPLSQLGRGGEEHILDPRRRNPGSTTGSARLDHRAVVTGPSACVADAWSTALIVLGTVPTTFPAGYTAHLAPTAHTGSHARATATERSMC